MSHPPLATHDFDLTSATGLKAACAQAHASLNRDRVQTLVGLLRDIRDSSETERARKDFQDRVWRDKTLWPGGLMNEEGFSGLLESAEFRTWFASQTVQSLPIDSEQRTQRLKELLSEVLKRFHALFEWRPWIESLRTLGLFFPDDFTGLARVEKLADLARAMGLVGGESNPVGTNRRVLDRLRAVIGPPTEGLVGTAERMLLPCELFLLIPPRLWVVRAGKNGEDEDFVLSNATAMLGYHELPDPGQSTKKAYVTTVQAETGWTGNQTANRAGQVWSFAHEIREHDIVVLPRKKKGPVHWGRVTGDYEYREVEGQDRHTRPVEWEPMSAPRQAFGDKKEQKPLNRRSTVYRIDNGAERVRVMEVLRKVAFSPFSATWNAMDRQARTENLLFERVLVEKLHLGLWTNKQRHFAVLSGLSGTGKTQIALHYAMALTGATSNTGGPVKVIAVHPGWHDPSPLLGYVNPLTRRYVRTEFLEFLFRTHDNPEETHVLILDEMNLSHPEQYFAPILSAMEITDGNIPLHQGNATDLGVSTSVPYPKNLVIIGTVNMDETTMGISDKVLDRAFTLEFWDIEPEKWPGWESCGLDEREKTKVRDFLVALTKTLSPARRHFGWRVIADVVGFLEGRSRDTGIEIGADAALDQAIYAKVLPKLRGSDTLRFRACLDDTIDALGSAGLEMCARKVKSLKEDLEATGSCSFWR